jgi:hypothetical protein
LVEKKLVTRSQLILALRSPLLLKAAAAAAATAAGAAAIAAMARTVEMELGVAIGSK